MVRLTTDDAKGAIQLLEQHHARKLVRQRERSEGQALAGTRKHVRMQTRRAAHHERDVAPARRAERFEPRSEARPVAVAGLLITGR